MRDPRGYIIPSDQADFATATEFVNALLKNGITVLRATAAFTVAGQELPGRLLRGEDRAGIPPARHGHVRAAGPPQRFPLSRRAAVPPYDITGWTLAMQMGVQFDRILDGFDGPFTKIDGLLPPPAGIRHGAGQPGRLPDQPPDQQFVHPGQPPAQGQGRRLLAEARTADGRTWAPAPSGCRPQRQRGRCWTQAAKELGVPVHAVAKAPAGDALKLKPVRIGLYDQYGGSMPSGWTRWLFEQYEFPFEVVYPPRPSMRAI